MKWKHTTPKLGDERLEIRFAWLPTKLSDGYTVWLEEYRVHFRYESRMEATKFMVRRTERWHISFTNIMK
jgi:hypothetical protein